MSFSKVQIAHLNQMNKASQSIKLGTLLDRLATSIGASGSHTATSGESSASAVTIPTGLSAIAGYQLQGFRSGSVITNVYVVSSTSGSIVARSGSFVTTGDLYNWIAW